MQSWQYDVWIYHMQTFHFAVENRDFFSSQLVKLYQRKSAEK